MKGREKESLEPVVSESVQVPATQAASEKVTNMVDTFLPEDGDGFQVSN
jgi:hypothetical protein